MIRKIVDWIKTHKAAAAGIAGGGFLILKNRGGGSSGGTVADSTGNVAQGDTVQLVPVTTGPIEDTSGNTSTDGTDTGTTSTIPPDTTGDTGGDTGGDTSAPVSGETSQDAPPAPPAPPDTHKASGGASVTIAGKTFPGAIGHSIVGSGKNKEGHYTTHLIRYPGRTERWNHYSSGPKAGKWVGPFGGNVTSPGAAPPASAPKPVTNGTIPAKPSGPKPGGPQPGHSKGHEYYVPGVGWVSKERWQKAGSPH